MGGTPVRSPCSAGRWASQTRRRAITITGVRERFRAAIKFPRLPGGRAPVASTGAAPVVLFTIAAAVALVGAGLGVASAGANAPSPRPAQIALATPQAPPAGLNVTPLPPPSAAATLAPTNTPGPALVQMPTPPPSPVLDATSTLTFHVPIFEYHRVKPWAGETGSAHDLIVPPSLFAQQMDAMAAAGWHTITMRELGDDMRRGLDPAPKSFVVTLDDGYEDGYTYARPILQSEGFVATYFVIGGRIGSPDQLTVAEMEALVAAGNEIGNHTLNHRDLKPMTLEEVVTEVYTTQALIASAVGVWPESFCYPMGMTDAAVTAIVSSTPDLVTAVIQTGSMPETWANRLSLPRIRVGPGSYPQYLVARADGYSQ